MNDKVFEYRGRQYPELLKHGNACQYIAPIAKQFCKGMGLDVGCGAWPLPGAVPIELKDGSGDAMALPWGPWDFIFSSHCAEHLVNPIAAFEHWRDSLVPGGVLFLYLPSPEMEYWNPVNCKKHLHAWHPAEMAKILTTLGFQDVLHSERDLAYGFSVVGFKPKEPHDSAA